jgi:hypothetical protein
MGILLLGGHEARVTGSSGRARVHDRLAVEHENDQVGVELFEEDIDGILIHLLGAVHSPEAV